MIAAAMIPLIAMLGSAIDISRAYMAKARLQQACDAGVLAGRRMQSDGGSFTAAAEREADNYFAFNYPDGMFGSTDIDFSAASDGKGGIDGTAEARLPTAIMRMFGYAEFPLEATCSAKLDIANTDVMFVLDATNSMNCPATTGVYCANSNNNGVEASDSRIKAVREATKSFHAILEGAKGSGTRVRYGFVPYNITANVGFLLPSFHIVDSWTYDSRERLSPSQWRHRPLQFDVSAYKTGVEVPNPASPGTYATWAGCIEERSTVVASDFDPMPANAYDMDIDRVPTDDDTRWRPLWPEAVFDRPANSTEATYSNAQSDARNARTGQSLSTACPARASKLAVRNASDVSAYVSGLKAEGNTYHDVGIMWGARLLSPTGIFGSENSTAPNGYPISRNIIFLTDGEPHPRYYDYAAFGLEHLSHRVAGGPYDDDTLTDLHVKKFSAICEAIKAKNISIWVITFGMPMNKTMEDCADPDKSFEANSADELNTQFERIATRIAQLRLTK